MKAEITFYDRDKRSNDREVLLTDTLDIMHITLMTKANGYVEEIERIETKLKKQCCMDENHMYWKIRTLNNTSTLNYTTTDIFIKEEK